MNFPTATINIDPQEFREALNDLHTPERQPELIKKQLQLVQHRFDYIRATPLKVLTQDRGFHKTLYLDEQEQLHCLLNEARDLANLPSLERKNREIGLYECLRNIVYDPELDYSKYELAKEIVSRRTVVCHIQIAAMNIISMMMIDKDLQSIEEMRVFFEELFTYFLIERPTTAACVNNRVTQNLSLHYSYMPAIVSRMLQQKLQLIRHDDNHHLENASFLNRLLTNFNIYITGIDRLQQLAQQHKVYDLLMFYKDLHEVDSADIELAEEVMGLIVKNKRDLLTFFEELFTDVAPGPNT